MRFAALAGYPPWHRLILLFLVGIAGVPGEGRALSKHKNLRWLFPGVKHGMFFDGMSFGSCSTWCCVARAGRAGKLGMALREGGEAGPGEKGGADLLVRREWSLQSTSLPKYG